jgi:hypothetical protein
MIADAIREAVKDDRERSGRTYHFRPGERMRVVCYACGGEDSEACEVCGGAGQIMTVHGGSAAVMVRRTGREISSPEEMIERYSLASDAFTVGALTEIEAESREYCASLFDDLAARITERECFGKLDDDEYSREAFSSALKSYSHHVRTYFKVKSSDRGRHTLKEFFSVPYHSNMEVRRLLTLEFDRDRGFDYRLAEEMGEDISARIAEDDVLEHLSEAVGARMIQIFYRGIEHRLDELVERGVPVDGDMVRRCSG